MEYYFYAEKMSVGYGKRPLIENMEIRLRKGEILTLIGPNGAGKSTVLKSIARQISLMGGAVYLDKRDIGAVSGAELSKKMAVVMTERLRAEMMTCEDVVATGRYPYTGHFGILSEMDRRKVKEAMELVRVPEIANQDFTCVSDGQRQRVMLARAICQEPEILLLDEPTSYLDVRYKLEFLSVLQELKKKKRLTVIMSLHELDLAGKVSDKILCLNGRYAERFGVPAEIFASGYIKELFHISMGSFDEENGSMELEAVRGTPEIFVIAGLGTGRDVYRSLQREGIPFATGILFKNDLDYPVAKALAAEIFAAEAFEPVPDLLLLKAEEKLGACKKVICLRKTFGIWETAGEKLLGFAKQIGKEIEFW